MSTVQIDGLQMKVNDRGQVRFWSGDDWFLSEKTVEEFNEEVDRQAKVKSGELLAAKQLKATPRKRRKNQKERKTRPLNPGDVYDSNSSGPFVIVSDEGEGGVVIRFPSGYERVVSRITVRRGAIKDKYKKTIYGVGCLGGDEYKSTSKAYFCWREMMRVCYKMDRGFSVCDEWLNFQTFAEWYYQGGGDDENSMRVLKKGDVYSPKVCILELTSV